MVRRSKQIPSSSLGKIWNFIWNDDSLASWVVSIILAFVIIKFLVYPGLGFLFGTSHPLVAVISGSMYHGLEESDLSACDGYFICSECYSEKVFTGHSFDTWWKECGTWYTDRNITKTEFKKYPLDNGFDKGDIILLKNADPKNVDIGSIIVFWSAAKQEPIIHRVIAIKEQDGKMFYTTKGDHNGVSGGIDKNIPEDLVIGQAWGKIPYIGYVKVLPFELINAFK